MKNKTIATITSLALAAGLSVATVAPAQASVETKAPASQAQPVTSGKAGRIAPAAICYPVYERRYHWYWWLNGGLGLSQPQRDFGQYYVYVGTRCY